MSISGSITGPYLNDPILREVILSPEEIVRNEVSKWDEYQQAIAYQYLNASGMNLSKAKDILNKRR